MNEQAPNTEQLEISPATREFMAWASSLLIDESYEPVAGSKIVDKDTWFISDGARMPFANFVHATKRQESAFLSSPLRDIYDVKFSRSEASQPVGTLHLQVTGLGEKLMAVCGMWSPLKDEGLLTDTVQSFNRLKSDGLFYPYRPQSVVELSAAA